MSPILIALIIVGVLALFGFIGLKSLFYNCAPNEVLIFSGGSRNIGTREVRYRLVKGGFGIRVPLLERVDRMDLTNMVIDLTASNAYSKGSIPLTVNGVANVKVAGHEPVMNNAIERFLGMDRPMIMMIAKATLEGSLRGVLATLTPEQVNNDRILFAERLVQEVEQDMTALGLVVDTLKIQNVSDDVGYLDSIGRVRNAEMISQARMAEAKAKAEAAVASAKNMEIEAQARVTADMSIAKAEAERRLSETLSQREALIAEQTAAVAADVAKSTAEIAVQTARLEQIKGQLEADVIEPAIAASKAAENAAASRVASIIEDGRARAEALKKIAETWQQSGNNARDIMVLQKLEPIIRQLAASVASTPIDRMTILDQGGDMGKLLALNEQAKQVLGIDIVEKLKSLGQPVREVREIREIREVKEEPAPEPEKKKPTIPPVIDAGK